MDCSLDRLPLSIWLANYFVKNKKTGTGGVLIHIIFIMKCCHRPSITLHCTDQRQLKKKIKKKLLFTHRPFVMASLALLLLSINCQPHPSASWPNMKVNLCNGYLSGVAGLWLVFLRANREDRHTNTHVPVWAGLFDVFMIRACSLRNCPISDLRSSGKSDKKQHI